MDLLRVIFSISVFLFIGILTYVLTWTGILKHSRIMAYIVRISARFLLNCVHLKVEMDPHSYCFPDRFIMISNHVSAFDGLLIRIHFPNVCIVSDIEHERIPFFGRLMRFASTFTIDRTSASSRITSFEKMIRKIASGTNLHIFYQGETSDRIAEAPMGAFIAAKKTRVPIVPVFLEFHSLNDFYFAPPWNLLNSYLKGFASLDKTIKIRIFPPILPHHFETPQALYREVLHQYQEWYAIYQEPHAAHSANQQTMEEEKIK